MKSFIILTLISLTACGQKQIKTRNINMDKFDEFINKEKFMEDYEKFYPGIADPSLRPILTEKINRIAQDFKEVSLTNVEKPDKLTT